MTIDFHPSSSSSIGGGGFVMSPPHPVPLVLLVIPVVPGSMLVFPLVPVLVTYHIFSAVVTTIPVCCIC